MMKPVAATPYAWPFDGAWSANDTAVLVIDAQSWLLRALARPDVEAAILQLLAAARGAGVRCIWTRRIAPTGGVALLRAQQAISPDALPPADAQALEIPAAFAAGDSLDRSASSAFTGTALAQMLQLAGIRNLILCGAVTEGAVHASMREANDRGFECLLVEDATASLHPAHHAAILRVTRFGNGLFGTTAPLAAVLVSMESDA